MKHDIQYKKFINVIVIMTPFNLKRILKNTKLVSNYKFICNKENLLNLSHLQSIHCNRIWIRLNLTSDQKLGS